MPGEVKIKVGLEGQQQTTQGLAQTEGAVKGVGAAGQAAAAGMRAEGQAAAAAAVQHDAAASTAKNLAGEQERLEDAGKKAGRGSEDAAAAAFDFHKKGEALAKDVLRLISPELANMADLMFNVAEGASRVTSALAAFAAAGAGIGVIVTAFEVMRQRAAELRESVNQIREVMASLREEGAKTRGGLASELASLGVGGQVLGGARVQETFEQWSRFLPGRDDLAKSIAVARGVGASAGMDVDPEQFFRGLAATGFVSPEFKVGAAKENAALIKKILAEGATDERAKQAATFEFELRGGLARPEGITASAKESMSVDSIDAAIQAIVEERPGLDKTPRNISALRELFAAMKAGKLPGELPDFAAGTGEAADSVPVQTGIASLFRDDWMSVPDRYSANPLGDTKVPGTTYSVGDIFELAKREFAKSQQAGSGGTPTTQPITINVNIQNQNQTYRNVQTQNVYGPEGGSKFGPAETIPGANGD